MRYKFGRDEVKRKEQKIKINRNAAAERKVEIGSWISIDKKERIPRPWNSLPIIYFRKTQTRSLGKSHLPRWQWSQCHRQQQVYPDIFFATCLVPSVQVFFQHVLLINCPQSVDWYAQSRVPLYLCCTLTPRTWIYPLQGGLRWYQQKEKR